MIAKSIPTFGIHARRNVFSGNESAQCQAAHASAAPPTKKRPSHRTLSKRATISEYLKACHTLRDTTSPERGTHRPRVLRRSAVAAGRCRAPQRLLPARTARPQGSWDEVLTL